MKTLVHNNFDNKTLIFVIFVAALITLPHAAHIPAPVFGFFVALFSYRLAGIKYPRMLPGGLLLFLITLTGIILIYSQHKSYLGLLAGTSFFITTLALKILEIKHRNEFYLVVFLSFFAAITQFLFNQSLLMAAYVLLVTGLLTAALITITLKKRLNINATLKLTGTLMLQALPIMILMFILFPRIPAPNIALPLPQNAATTGLSDSLRPGQISQLSQSSKLAFRVKFDGEPPAPKQRYWRGPVFWKFDGQQWDIIKKPLGIAHGNTFLSNAYQYTVTLEPHGQKWLFALDIPSNLPHRIRQTADLLLMARKPVTQRRSYTLTSYTQYKTGQLSDWEKKLGLQIPATPDQRILSLISHWQQGSSQTEAIVRQALDFFNKETFFYTLTPPLYEEKPIESFLFTGRRGFCEHYATAFVYLMRIAGIPARVVTGYQGGEFNTLGQFLEVRQSDAHAWAEVWLGEKGWVRIDPTAAVAPERIEQGIGSVSGYEYDRFEFTNTDLAGLSNLVLNLRFAWATVDHAWHRWIITYNAVSQNEFLSKLGIDDIQSMVFILVGTVMITLALSSIVILYNQKKNLHQAVILYQRFCKKISATGLTKTATESAGDFATRAIVRRPDLSNQILSITALYQNIRYGKVSDAAEIVKLRKKIHKFYT